MPNLIDVEYAQTGQSTSTNEMGMRDMQVRAYDGRDAQYLLLKSPPASGKSRALMYIALDKLTNQGVKKVIVAVPENTIGGSFVATDLKSNGFFRDWSPSDEYNLCTSAGSASKVQAFHKFLGSDKQILICTHATLRFACEGIDESQFNDVLLAIDEFHHVSADVNSVLGEVLRGVVNKSSAHIVAMTGSYFRGDSVPILLPEDEAKFTKVTYNYYEQLNGYTHLKSLGIGYHFYQGRYTTAIMEVLDLDKKTILHIPNVNAVESTGDKDAEVGFILDAIGDVVKQDADTGVMHVKRKDNGKILKVADLVEDNPVERNKIDTYLMKMNSLEDMDLIIALGKAKEGFDWPYCEHALTVGYRSSLTEIIQIIGRATRDSSNKTHAQFTNLVAQPDAEDLEVRVAVNNMLKAITASLLMEQVLAPSFKFKTKLSKDDRSTGGEIKIKGLKEPSSKRVKDIVESDLNDLKAAILQDPQMLKAMPGNIDPKVMNEVLIPKVIRTKHPELSDDEIEEVRQHVVTDSAIRSGKITGSGDQRFITMSDTFVNIDEISIDLIDTINPFQSAFEIMSRSVPTQVLKIIQETIQANKITMSDEEAVVQYGLIGKFMGENNGKKPSLESSDPLEKRMAECIIYLNDENRKRIQGG